MAFNKNFKGGAREYGRPREDRGGFGGGKRFGDKPRGGFGGGDRGSFGSRDAGPREMFSATCANCNKTCEVPFRPNGQKPVYCKDCFGTMKGADEVRPQSGFGDRGERDSRNDRPRFDARPQQGANTKELEQKVDALTKRVEALSVSLDYAIKLFKGEAPIKKVEVVAEKKDVVEKAAKEAKPASKEARLAKKAAPAKVAKKKSKK